MNGDIARHRDTQSTTTIQDQDCIGLPARLLLLTHNELFSKLFKSMATALDIHHSETGGGGPSKCFALRTYWVSHVLYSFPLLNTVILHPLPVRLTSRDKHLHNVNRSTSDSALSVAFRPYRTLTLHGVRRNLTLCGDVQLYVAAGKGFSPKSDRESIVGGLDLIP